MRQKQKKHILKLVVQFIKLQLAGNVLFWGTYIGFFIFDQVLNWPELIGLATASVIAHILFFIIDKEWVFADKSGRRKTSGEVARFIAFMGFNYFLNLGIIEGLSVYFDLSPYYGQFVAAAFFTLWNYAGLKFWVFQVPEHHAITIKKTKGAKHVRRRQSPQQKTA